MKPTVLEDNGLFFSEFWHLAAFCLALVILLGRWAAPHPPDPWGEAQSRVARKLDRITTTLDREALRERLIEQPALLQRANLLIGAACLALLVGCGLLARALLRLARRQPMTPGWFVVQPSDAYVPWGVWDVTKVFAWLICVAQALQVVLLLGLQGLRVTGVDRHLAATVSTLLLDFLALALVGLIIVRRYRLPLTALGVRGQAWLRQVMTGVTGYLMWLPCFVGTVLIVMAVVRWLHIEPKPQAVVTMLLEETRPRLLILLMGLVAVVGPIAEEVVFRGVTYAALRRRFGIGWALWGSAALFAAVHADLMAFAPILVLGLLLGWLYEQSGSLIPSMAVHMLHNSGMLLLALTIRDLLQLLGDNA